LISNALDGVPNRAVEHLRVHRPSHLRSRRRLIVAYASVAQCDIARSSKSSVGPAAYSIDGVVRRTLTIRGTRVETQRGRGIRGTGRDVTARAKPRQGARLPGPLARRPGAGGAAPQSAGTAPPVPAARRQPRAGSFAAGRHASPPARERLAPRRSAGKTR